MSQNLRSVFCLVPHECKFNKPRVITKHDLPNATDVKLLYAVNDSAEREL